MKKKFNHIINYISKVLFIILGSIFASVGLEIFLIPNNIIDGGMICHCSIA